MIPTAKQVWDSLEPFKIGQIDKDIRMKPTKKSKYTPKSKGKRHPLFAETLDQLSDKLESNYSLVSGHELSRIFRDEVKRVRGILR